MIIKGFYDFFTLKLIFMLFNIFNIIVLLKKLRCSFCTNSRQTRNIIRSITYHREIIDNLIRANTHLFKHGLLIISNVFHGIEHFDFATNKLHKVLISRGDNNFIKIFAPLSTSRTDNIISLIIIM